MGRRNRHVAVPLSALIAFSTSAAATPVSWWRGDGDANDAVGTNHGTLVGGTGFAPGVRAQAFSFDGSNDGVNVPDAPSLRLGSSLTIEATIRPLSYTGFLGGMILFRGDDRTGLDPYFMRLLPDGRLEFAVDNAQNTRAQLQSQVIPLDEFTYVAGALDGATGRMELRVNGVAVASTFTDVRPLLELDPARNPGLAIGNHNRYPPFPYNIPFHGVIDQVRLHDAFLIPGDANYDGVVNLQDFNRVAANFGAGDREWTQGDFTGDAAVDLADFNIVAAHFGLAASADGPTARDWAALAAAVPEPPAPTALLPGLLVAGRRARRRQQVNPPTSARRSTQSPRQRPMAHLFPLGGRRGARRGDR